MLIIRGPPCIRTQYGATETGVALARWVFGVRRRRLFSFPKPKIAAEERRSKHRRGNEQTDNRKASREEGKQALEAWVLQKTRCPYIWSRDMVEVMVDPPPCPPLMAHACASYHQTWPPTKTHKHAMCGHGRSNNATWLAANPNGNEADEREIEHAGPRAEASTRHQDCDCAQHHGRKEKDERVNRLDKERAPAWKRILHS